ncbi:MAG: 1-deoxy-D-xylulose-5-phosphate synthase [Eubacteriales bacterium]|jgi:1-deoxy-D-xylulose-5-phosphate synthase
MVFLDNIMSPEDVKKLNIKELTQLSDEIRTFLIESIARSGGHLASNLGVVELTVALHKVFDTSVDRLVFDVGHQCYTHKILTGRREEFTNLRSLDGLSGFPKPSESIHDPFSTGHASTSISAALGIARARTLSNDDYHVIAVIGDGALTGGLAYEALNDAGQSKERLIVILNDNGMSIQRNVGGVARQLGRLRLKPQYSKLKKRVRGTTSRIPGGKYVYRVIHNTKMFLKHMIVRGSMFEDMGFTYLGPVDGHDLKELCRLLQIAKGFTGPVLIHLTTVKGKGYRYSEESPSEYHGISQFDIDSGRQLSGSAANYSLVFGNKLIELAQKDQRICAITAAMQSGTGLDKFSAKFPQRFFDVGIAEEHAVTMAAGMASRGMRPVCAIYSTFLQRSYDMIIHDVALQNLPVVFAIDRAGLTGEDGETHQGVFDISFLPQIPGVRVYCPSSYAELEVMLEQALSQSAGPVAVRYPRGCEGEYRGVSEGDAEVFKEGSDITVVVHGRILNEVIKAAKLAEADGVSVEIVKLNVIAPLPVDIVLESVKKTKRFLAVEESLDEGCAGRRLLSEIGLKGMDIKSARLINLGNRFIPQGNMPELMAKYGLDAYSIASVLLEECTGEKKNRSTAV